MAYPHYRSQFGDTTFTKVFVGGLAWETPTEEMRRYFQQFGDILEAVIITDKNTGKSKGYGFVTFRDPESARRSCENPNPVIDGRRANCNIASLGRPRPSPPRGSTGRNPGGGSFNYQGGGPSYGGGVAGPVPPPPAPPVPPVIYQPYGYTTFSPEYGYHQAAVYNQQLQQQQYYQQVYGTTSTGMASPYLYGSYPRPTFPAAASPHQQRLPSGASYLYYHPQLDQPSFSTYPPLLQLPRHPFQQPSSDSSQTPQHTSTEGEARVITSESPNTS